MSSWQTQLFSDDPKATPYKDSVSHTKHEGILSFSNYQKKPYEWKFIYLLHRLADPRLSQQQFQLGKQTLLDLVKPKMSLSSPSKFSSSKQTPEDILLNIGQIYNSYTTARSLMEEEEDLAEVTPQKQEEYVATYLYESVSKL